MKDTFLNDSTIRPWSRLFARMVDHILYSLLLVFIIFVFNLYAEGFITYILVFSTIIITEALLLSKWGYTPGKYLFAIQVRKLDSSKLSFQEAAKRTWRVLFEGLWLMLPIIGIIGGINAWVYLSSKGQTSWDEKGEFKIKKTRK